MRMLVYHFTTAERIESIQRRGLTAGVLFIPSVIGHECIRNVHWLTVNPDITAQKWAKAKEADYRVTIDIPACAMRNLYGKRRFESLHPNTDQLFDTADSRDWRLYCGRIPQSWIMKVEKVAR